ncbi:MAG: efflux RND transporter periplasmic adaptor subunit [Saprospiraceae bacterium]|jgi:multidrug efflux system membrane fusion protein|nr:efflux RND transporter periplasmic adaptor subunit [Saprospiraceae bacterium]
MKTLNILIAIIGICFFACKSEQVTQESGAKITETFVKTHNIENIDESNAIQVLGIVMSESEARPSFKTGGVIKKTYFKEGDMVAKGQLLATLEMDEINAQVQQAEEGMQKALRDKNRVANLYKDSVATLEQFQNVNTAFEVAKRTAEIAAFNKKYSEIRSPIAGKVIKQIMYSGEVTGPGNPIYAILGVGKGDWVIKAGLTDRDWARVNKNDKVKISLDAYPGQSYTGIISEKSSVGGNASGTFDVHVRFDQQPQNLAAGLIANLSIASANKEKYTVIPIESLIKSNGKTAFVFTADNGKAKLIKISIAKLLGDKVAVTSGLEGVTNVITIGAMYLEDGENIKY